MGSDPVDSLLLVKICLFYDETEDYYGESYDEVKMEFEMMKQSFLTGRY